MLKNYGLQRASRSLDLAIHLRIEPSNRSARGGPCVPHDSQTPPCRLISIFPTCVSEAVSTSGIHSQDLVLHLSPGSY